MKSIARVFLLLFLLTLSFAPVSTYAQGGGGGSLPGVPEQGLEFEHITVEQGLSEGTVTRILQDSRGFMWFCTSNGLNRYDGYTFTVYQHNPDDPYSLSSNELNVIYEDMTGALWIGTNASGLERFDRATEQFTHYAPSPDDPKSLIGNIVRAIYQDRSGVLWVGTDEGLNRLDQKTGQFTRYTHVPNVPSSLSGSDVRAIYEDSVGVFWVGTYSGLDQLDRATGQVTARYRNDPAAPNSLSSDFVEQIYEDAKGNLWVGTRRGLNKLDRATGQFKQYLNIPNDSRSLSHNAIRAIYEDSREVLWVGTDDGLNTLDRDTEQFTRYYQDQANPQSLSSSLIQSIAEDRMGAIWIGTFGGGVNRLDRASRRFALYTSDPNNPQSLSSNNVVPIYEDREGNLWVGTNGGGLNRINRKSGRVTHYRNDPNDPQSLGSNFVTSIAQDPAGKLWVAAFHGGLNRLDPATGKFTRYRNDSNDPASLADDDVWTVWVDRAGTLWIGTSKGLDRLDPTTNTFVGYQYGPRNPYSLSSNDVRAIYEDSAGSLWIGTMTGGLNRLERATDTFTRYQYNPNDPRSLSGNQVNTLYQDSTGNLWIGTSAGLDRLDAASGAIVHYRKKDGLPDDNIQGILEDDQGNLWLSTNGGLAKFNLQTETFKNYDARDGLQSAQFNLQSAFKSASGEMFFGGPNGLNAFFPDQVTDNPNIPNVVLTGFQLFDRPVLVGAEGSPLQKHINETDHIILSYEQSAISLEFAALNYRSSDKNQYAYKLEGFDKDWKYADSTRRLATYTDLSPGDYVFRVKGSNNDGVWNETGKTVKITITPPWWQTTWFRVLVVVLVLGSVYGAYLWRVSTIQGRTRQLERLVAERTADLERRAVQLQAAAEVARDATAVLDIEELMRTTVKRISDRFGFYHAGLFLVDDAREYAVLRAASSEGGRRMLERNHKLRVGEVGIVGYVAATGEHRIALDAGADAVFFSNPDLPDTRSEIALPLRARGEIIGALDVQSTEPAAFSEEDVAILGTMADQVAVAINNAQLFARAQAALEEAARAQESAEKAKEKAEQARESAEAANKALEGQIWRTTGQAQLGDKMRGEQDIPTLASNVIQQLCQYLQAQIGALYVTEDSTLNLVGGYAYASKNPAKPFKFGEGLVGQAALEKQPLIVTDIPEDCITTRSALGEIVPRHIMVLPFVYEDRVVGVVEMGTLTEFSPAQMDFVQTAMANVAIAFTTAQARARINELLAETQQQAEELQAQEEELRVANEELEAQTESLRASEAALKEKQAAVDSQNRELKAAQQELERKAAELALASKYKSEFLANMSHELRTPLNSLLILARMLADNEEGNLSEEQVESAQVIYSGGNDLLNLINDILDLSKVEAGRMTFNVEPMLLSDLVAAVRSQFAHVAEEKGLELNIRLGDDLPASIETDQQRVKQIVKNLLSNAFKFTSEGSVSLNIYRPDAGVDLSRSGLDPSQAMAISVTDTGIGIAPEQQKVIFEAFQQADGSTSRQYGGTGLGLSISRELASKLGGQIDLASEPGRGSTFTLYLPEVRSQEDAVGSKEDEAREVKDGSRIRRERPQSPGSRPPTPAAPPLAPTPCSLLPAPIPDDRDNLSEGDKILLIVEDDPKFAKIVSDYAHEKGFKCLMAGDGKTGLELVKSHQAGAIILDLNLPDISGWQVLEVLKYDPNTRHIPVHIMSVDEETLDAYRRGAMGYLTKPVSREDLAESFQRIEQFISREIKALLLVEDDARSRRSIKKLLGGSDVQISEADGGQTALDLLKAQHFDCMILDLNLPDMTGFEVLSRMNEDESYARCPVIVYTGRDLTPEENLELMKYANSVIVKGVKSPERLLDETALFLHRVVADMPEAKQQTIKQLYNKEGQLEGKKILIVDDDMRNSFALSRLLSDKGVIVKIAQNGQKALELLAETLDMDLVLMDIMMPVMDGYETIGRIRAQREFRTLPILALTAKAMKGDREKCLTAGANDYLPKPVDVDRLFSMLRVWLYQ